MSEPLLFIANQYNEDRTECHEMQLRLLPQGACELITGFFYSDWGDRVQDIDTHRGTYKQDGKRILCHLTEVTRDHKFDDHEMGTHEETCNKEDVDLTFEFEAEGKDVMLLRSEWEKLPNARLASGTEPQRMIL